MADDKDEPGADDQERDPKLVAIGDRIRTARERKGLGQAELGGAIGLKNDSSMWRYESGTSPIPLDRLEKIADVLEVSIDWILSRQYESQEVDTSALQAPVPPGTILELNQAGTEAAILNTPEASERFGRLILRIARDLRGR